MANPLSNLPIANTTRRNHALEHATMQVLAAKYPGVKMAGMSGPTGFVLFADLPTEIVTDGVLEAQRRLSNGEVELAVHPNCGTNLVTSSLLAGAAAYLTLWGSSGRRKPGLANYLLAFAVALPIFIASRPMGPCMQRIFTTDPDLAGRQVRLVESRKTHGSFVHHITTGI
jgi:hypothetical protein